MNVLHWPKNTAIMRKDCQWRCHQSLKWINISLSLSWLVHARAPTAGLAKGMHQPWQKSPQPWQKLTLRISAKHLVEFQLRSTIWSNSQG
jgi:hypothetical protein